MKILAIVPAYRVLSAVGGGEISNRMLFEGLVAQGHQVTVVAIRGLGGACKVYGGVKVYQSSKSYEQKFGSWVAERARFYSLTQSVADAFAPDVILSSNEVVPVAIKVGRRLRVNVGALVRAYESFLKFSFRGGGEGFRKAGAKEWIKRGIFGDFGINAIRQCRFLITNSEYMKSLSLGVFGNVDSYVVYPPIDEMASVPCIEDSPVRTVALVATRPEKGGDLIRAVAENIPDMNFRFLGCPDVAAGREVIDDNVIKTGWCDIGQEFREKSDLVVVPSEWDEPFGRVAVEALMAGKPVLVSDRGGLREAVGNQPELIVTAGSPEAWTERLAEIVRDPAPLIRGARRARNGLAVFGLQRQVNNLEKILRAMI